MRKLARAELVEALDYLAADLGEQGMKAHIQGATEKSEALYGFQAAIHRAQIDVLGRPRRRGPVARLRERLGIA